MAQIISLNIPHVAKKIFQHVDSSGLIKCLYVSKTWRQLAQETFENRLNEIDDYGLTPFAYACKFGHTFVVRIILNCPESKREMPYLNYCSTSSPIGQLYLMQTPFMFACENGHEDVVKLLLDYSGIEEIAFNRENCVQKTAFMLACQNGHLKVIKLIFDYSASKSIILKTRDVQNKTALMLAMENGHNEVFKLFFDHYDKEDFDFIFTDYGLDTFVVACHLGQIEMVKAMLDHPQSITQLKINEIGYGRTPFMDGFLEATKYSKVDVANMLLYHPKTQSINWNAWDGRTGWGPLFLRVCEMPQSKEIIKLILDHSFFDLNVRGVFGNTGFMIACIEQPWSYGSQEIIELLMQNSVRCNIDLNAKDDNGQTVFMKACAKGLTGLVKLLVQNSKNTRLDVNATNFNGQTALMIACSNFMLQNNSGVAILFIEYIKRGYLRTIKLNIKDCFGSTALMIACKNGKVQIVKLLLDLNNIELPSREELYEQNITYPNFTIVLDMIKAKLEQKLTNPVKPLGNDDEAGKSEQLGTIDVVEANEEDKMEVAGGVVEANEGVRLDSRHDLEGGIERTGKAETYEELLEDMDYMEASDENDDDVLSYESDDNDA